MPSASYKIAQTQGYLPSVDARNSQQLFVLGGKNFAFDALGVKSAFGSKHITYRKFDTARLRGIQIFTYDMFDDLITLIVSDNIYRYRHEQKDYILLAEKIVSIPSDIYYKWSTSYYRNLLFMTHQLAGIFVYNRFSDTFFPYKTSVTINNPILSIFINGRFVIVTDEYFYYSAAFNPEDFTPSLGGAGFQRLATHVSGDPIAITQINQGCLVWTTEGVMKADFVSGEAVFRFSAVNIKVRPLNSFCVVSLDEGGTVMLTQNGLFILQNETLAPLTPLFNEFLMEFIAQNNLDTNPNSVQLQWNQKTKQLFVMCDLDDTGIFEQIFVWNQTVDRWGILSKNIYAVGKTDVYNFGYIDSDGYLKQFTSNNENSGLVQDGDNGRFFPAKVASYSIPNELFVRAQSSLNFGHTDEQGYFDSNWIELYGPRLDFDSEIILGAFKLNDTDKNERQINITSVEIGSAKAAPFGNIIDFNQPDAVVPKATDLGLNLVNISNYAVEAISSLDGYSETYRQRLEPVTTSVHARFYPCTINGIYVLLRIFTENPEDYFRIRTLSTTYIDGGTL